MKLGAAYAAQCQDFAIKHNLSSDFYETATLDIVKSVLDANHTVVLDTRFLLKLLEN